MSNLLSEATATLADCRSSENVTAALPDDFPPTPNDAGVRRSGRGVESGYWSRECPPEISPEARDLALQWLETSWPKIESRVVQKNRNLDAEELDELRSEVLARCWLFAVRRAVAGGRDALVALSAHSAYLACVRRYFRGVRFASGPWRLLQSLDAPRGRGGEFGNEDWCLGDTLTFPPHMDPREITRIRLDYSEAAARMDPAGRRLFLHLCANPADCEISAEHLGQSLGLGSKRTMQSRMKQIRSIMTALGYRPRERQTSARWPGRRVFGQGGFRWRSGKIN